MKRNSRILWLTLFWSAFSAVGCALNAPLPDDYYTGTDKIAGGNPPSIPVLTFSQAQLRFDFTAAIDPESNSEVVTYIVYGYSGLPKTYYLTRDIAAILSSPQQRTFYYTGETFGTHTVVLTGYDGYRESAVTDQNKITFSFP